MREDGKQHRRRFRVATSRRTANERRHGGVSLCNMSGLKKTKPVARIYALLLNTHILQAQG